MDHVVFGSADVSIIMQLDVGYTRVIKAGFCESDAAPMGIIELVDVDAKGLLSPRLRRLWR